ncbi:MAG: X2-like carbohydrate binding domain-containing protein, partial [Anaerovoracaceae bacterium]
EGNQKDILVKVNLNGNTLKNITNGGTVLKSGIDYIIEEISPARSSADYPESSSLILYIQKSYLAKLRSGIQTLKFNFNPYGVEGGLVINTPLEITIKDTGHVHDFATEFTIDRNSTCSEKGEKSKHCKDFALCGGKTDITEVELAPHAFFDVHSFDENEHWNICINCTGKVNVAKHTWTTSKNQPGGESIWGMNYLLFADLVAPSHGETPTILDYRCTGCKATKSEEYKLTEKIHDMTTGDNLVHAIGTKEGITFASVAHINEYLGTTIDKIPLKQDDIKVKAGSTIVTIGSAYLDTLPNGKHTVSIYSTTGTATANFTVVGNKEIVPPEKPINPEKPTTPVTPTTPKTPSTGDNGNMPLWISLVFVSGGALLLFGISKKRRKVNEK